MTKQPGIVSRTLPENDGNSGAVPTLGQKPIGLPLRNAFQAAASDRCPTCRARRARAQIVECPIVAQLLHRAS